MNTKISIIIPVYNVEKYLSKCLDSVINQTYKNLEIIIVNDCSPDNSEQIILDYKKNDSRIIYVKNEQNIGPLQTRRKGLSVATSDFIAYIDSDDTFSSMSILEKCISKLNSSDDIDIIAYGWNVVFENKDKSHIISTILKDKVLITAEEKLNEFLIEKSITDSMAKKVFRKAVLKEGFDLIGQEQLVFQEDGLMFMYIIFHSKTIVMISSIGYNYLQREGSSTFFEGMSKERVLKTLHDWIYVVKTSIQILKDNQLWTKYCVLFYERHQSFYKWIYHPLKDCLTEDEYKENEYLFIEAFLPSIFQHNCQTDKWYRFGQLSRIQKIKHIVKFVIKKIYKKS